MRIRSFQYLVSALLFAGVSCHETLDERTNVLSVELPQVQQCRQLHPREVYSFVEALAESRDFEGLEAIYRANVEPGSECASGALARLMDSNQVVEFCRSMKVGTDQWRSAFWNLQHHPREQVIGYILEIMQSETHPNMRWLCYSVCTNAGWADLLEFAYVDQYDEIQLRHINETFLTPTLGKVARDYIAKFQPEP